MKLMSLKTQVFLLLLTLSVIHTSGCVHLIGLFLPASVTLTSRVSEQEHLEAEAMKKTHSLHSFAGSVSLPQHC